MLNFLKEERSDWDKTQSSDCATTVKQSFLFLCHIYRQGCGVVGATGFGWKLFPSLLVLNQNNSFRGIGNMLYM